MARLSWPRSFLLCLGMFYIGNLPASATDSRPGSIQQLSHITDTPMYGRQMMTERELRDRMGGDRC